MAGAIRRGAEMETCEAPKDLYLKVTCIHTYIHKCIHTYINAYIHTYIHTYILFSALTFYE